MGSKTSAEGVVDVQCAKGLANAEAGVLSSPVLPDRNHNAAANLLSEPSGDSPRSLDNGSFSESSGGATVSSTLSPHYDDKRWVARDECCCHCSPISPAF